uniref:Potassium-transporting ATPase potassium-binding subunit n=1 Tax=Solibacter usitatus (strain Ellin6076) TaxID=234267 RepID=KDPA_SOLUE|nr:RecName: Full=Potassium-transporting ATPase potassium-binding subunit; AltName: Full=ATP phosphohydrolase [potassium-transporting] A chain; AltName: Full=Potassium-binding and translocating subunit A; AltName: Full=Potassium-translocating ATPase A chain [Candidatus Solibacter usitatus Ellin6076]
MTTNGILQILAFTAIIWALAKPIGGFMAKVFAGERTWLHRILRPVEVAIYKLCGVDEAAEQRWTGYAGSLLAFSLVSLLFTYLIQRVQQWLPLNPQGLANVAADLGWNTAASFTTNTNWQAYTPETTMSYITQMIALATHNFFSAAAGIAVAIAFVRGFSRHSANTLGNFWVDFTRATLYILLPMSLLAALFFCSQGVIQNLDPYTKVTTLEGAVQTIPQGPVASQEAIKMLGTNGGGFFNANSAHPYENPTPLANLAQMVLIFLIPAGLTYTFGKMIKDTRQGWALLAAMTVLFLAGVCVVYPAEQAGNPVITRLGVAGGNMEGKEVRFGIANSALFTVVTTDASCGAVNNVHDSLTPLGGLVPLVNIELGEVVFGGVGSGLYGMLLFAILAVFIAGLMVGRTPEYLGKKIEQKEVKMVMLSVLVLALCILGFSAAGIGQQTVANSMTNHGPHGLTEVLYGYTSAAGNNGSAFAGLSANTMYLNTTLGIAMLCGRFLMLIPLLAAAGSLAQKKLVPVSAGTFPTHGPLFVTLLVGVVVIVGALTFFPALSLGPIVEHFLMHQGRLWS